MADSKLQRPVQSEMTHGHKGSDEMRAANAAAAHKRRPEEEVSDSGENAEAAGGADAAVADSTVVEAGTAPSGMGSLGLTALGGLGLLGVVAAAAGGGGGKDSTLTPPIQQLPDPVIPQQPKPDAPKPQEPKPEEPKPVEPKPAEPKPAEPTPEQPKPVESNPEQPKPVDPVEPMPEQPKSDPKPDVTPPETKPETPSTSEPTTPDQPKPVDAIEPVSQQPDPKPDVTPPKVTPPVVTPPTEPTAPPTPNPVDPAPEQPKPEAPPPDTTPPAKPELALKNDTGEAGDNITSDGTITVSGLEEGASWRYSEDGGKTWHQGEGEEVPASRFEGKHEVKVVQLDRAGNESSATNLQYTLDTGAPMAALKNDTARELYDDALGKWVSEDRHLHDGITKDATVTLAGIKDGATWMYSVDEGASWKQGSGSEIAASEFGEDGQKIVWTKQMVTTTTESGISTFSFVLDTHAMPLTIGLKSSELMNDAGLVAKHPVITIEGLEDDGGVVMSLFGGDLGSRPEVVIGKSELPLDLLPGQYRVGEVRQIDAAGNEVFSHQVLDFTVPRACPNFCV
ncbi:Ig-like domain-containing protein [Roseateles sp.]|uniref:Ig-like domain-containing protein n=1 Tax=Roseateles sp. TaxID=1971397 RepID=UPI0031CFF6B8